MKIEQLRVTIRPHTYHVTAKELHVEVIANGVKHSFVNYYHENDFESLFECMMNDAKREILNAVKSKQNISA